MNLALLHRTSNPFRQSWMAWSPKDPSFHCCNMNYYCELRAVSLIIWTVIKNELGTTLMPWFWRFILSRRYSTAFGRIDIWQSPSLSPYMWEPLCAFIRENRNISYFKTCTKPIVQSAWCQECVGPVVGKWFLSNSGKRGPWRVICLAAGELILRRFRLNPSFTVSL